MALGSTIGLFVGGGISSAIGRIRTMVLFGVPVTLSHIILALASSPVEVDIACFILGLCQMGGWVTGSVFESACSCSQSGDSQWYTFQLSLYLR